MLSRNQAIAVLVALLATAAINVQAHGVCEPEAHLRDLWPDAPVLKCAGPVALQSSASAQPAPLPYKWGGPLPPNALHLWPRVAPVAPWPGAAE